MSEGPAPQSSQLLLAMERISAIADDMRDVKANMGRLADAVAKLAIVEERQVADRQALARAFAEIDKVSARVAAIEQAQPIQKQSSDWVQRAVAAILGAVLASGVGMLQFPRTEKAPTAQIGRALPA